MQVRVFESADMASGLKQIKRELGPDALILSTRTIRNGALGLLGKPILEITAAIDTDIPVPQAAKSSKANKKQKENRGGHFHQVVNDSVEEFLDDFPLTFSETPLKPPQDTEILKVPSPPADFNAEVHELKELVKNLSTQISQMSKNSNEEHIKPVPPITDAMLHRQRAGNNICGDYILSMLIERGVNIEPARTIAGFLRQSLTDIELSDSSHVLETITMTIQNLIEVSAPVFTGENGQQIIALVGATGVGKTTTIAKIAASYLSRHSNSVALITIDTYRIAAVEQLKVYGEIMHLPVDVVITPEQLQTAIARHSDKELILIDTAGRSPRDQYCIEELATFLSPDLGIEKHLVLSATTRETEMLRAVERFSALDINNTIFTKIDECSNLGILLNVQIQNSSPVSYITNGQRVPEDILEITPRTVAELIMSQFEGSVND